MVALRELIRGAWQSEESRRREESYRAAYRQIEGGMTGMRQILSEVRVDDPKAILVIERFDDSPELVMAVRWGFLPKYGFEKARQMAPSERERPTWFESKGVGIKASPVRKPDVVFTQYPSSWDYLKVLPWQTPAGEKINPAQFPLIDQLRHARMNVGYSDDYRYGRGFESLKMRLGADKNWQILKF